MDTRRWGVGPLLCSSALLSPVAPAGSALAQEQQGVSVRTMTVRFGDLNLSTPAGAETLYHRIRGAARAVCGEEESYEIGLDVRHYWHSCYQSAINDAVRKVHSPLLEAVHLRSTPEALHTAMLGR
jgi:UrcA family protein